MIRFIIDKSEDNIEISVHGDLMTICAEISAAISDVHTQMCVHNPSLAAAFRTFMRCAFTADSPVWDKIPAFGSESIYAEFPGKDMGK